MSEVSSEKTNPLAIAGLAFAGLAFVLYAVSFVFVGTLPNTVAELETLRSSPAELTRFVVLIGSAVLLNLVAISLSITGLFLPGRPRINATLGVLLSGLMLIGIPGVMVVGLLAG